MIEQEEIWKVISKSDGSYEVSNFGRVKRTVYKKMKDSYECIFISQCINNMGYKKLQMNCCPNGSRKGFYVHRLVAEYFLENPQCKPMVNHLDGDKENNHASNLEWVTNRENSYHSFLEKGLLDCGLRYLPKSNIWTAYAIIEGKEKALKIYAETKEQIRILKIKKLESMGIFNKYETI